MHAEVWETLTYPTPIILYSLSQVVLIELLLNDQLPNINLYMAFLWVNDSLKGNEVSMEWSGPGGLMLVVNDHYLFFFFPLFVFL